MSLGLKKVGHVYRLTWTGSWDDDIYRKSKECSLSIRGFQMARGFQSKVWF